MPMEIRIDTEKDSHEHIRKAIGFLQNIVGDKAEATDSSEIAGDTGLFGMFNDQDTHNDVQGQDQDSMFNIFSDETNDSPDNGSFSLDSELARKDFDTDEDSEGNDDDIRIIPY